MSFAAAASGAPINRTLLVDEASKAVSPFPFVA